MSTGGSPPGFSRRDLLTGALAAALALGLNAGYVSVRLGFVHKPKQARETDHFRYIEMAKGDGGRQELAREPPATQPHGLSGGTARGSG